MKYFKTVAGLIVLSGFLFAQTQHIVQVSPNGAQRPVEPTIAINPTNPDNIVGASIRYGVEGETRVVNMRYHSEDAGKTWRVATEANPFTRAQGDDAIVFNAEGVAYHSFICFRGLRTTKTKANGIYVTRSEANSNVWGDHLLVVDHLNTLRPYEDKPYLCTDNSEYSPHRNYVYIAWTRFDEYHSKLKTDSSQIYFSRSTNNGDQFDVPFRISDTGGDCDDGDNTVEGAVPAAGPDGEVYISWSGPKGLVFDKSLDGGKTFGKDRVISDLPGGWSQDIDGILRCNGFPVTKTDISGGKHHGSVYINWTDERNGDVDVFLMYSRDKGETWSKQIRVNADKKGNGKQQFFTWMAVDPVDGSINIIYNDRAKYSGTKTGLTISRSIDGGESFKHYPVKIDAFECNKEVFFGDYNNIDAYNGRVAAIFPHFISNDQTVVSALTMDFKPGTQKAR
ncbi:MAG: hypothetical protein ACRBF0_22035 [Calditrichia bacterium]